MRNIIRSDGLNIVIHSASGSGDIRVSLGIAGTIHLSQIAMSSDGVQPRTIGYSANDVMENLMYFFGTPAAPEKLKDYSEHHALTGHFPGVSRALLWWHLLPYPSRHHTKLKGRHATLLTVCLFGTADAYVGQSTYVDSINVPITLDAPPCPTHLVTDG